MSIDMREAAKKIRESETICIYTHVNMDGDALGSSAALCLALRTQGHNACVVISEDIPRNLDFLESGCCINIDDVPDKVDLSLMLDCSSYNRIPDREAAFDRGVLKGCIDHHAMGATTIDFDFQVVEPDASATGELVFRLLKELGTPITLDIANCLWTAISTDSGNFVHNSTSAFTHEMAAELHRVEGFDSSVLGALIYQRRSINAMMLENRMLSNIRFFADNKVAITAVTIDMLDELGCVYSDSDSVINTLRNLDGVEVAVVLKQTEPELFKASMRARSYANVAVVATKYGGGGHIRAAGCPLRGSLDDVIDMLSKDLIEAVKN